MCKFYALLLALKNSALQKMTAPADLPLFSLHYLECTIANIIHDLNKETFLSFTLFVYLLKEYYAHSSVL